MNIGLMFSPLTITIAEATNTPSAMLEGFYARISEELGAIEERLTALLASELELIQEINRHMVSGKRYRPALALFFYKLFGGEADREQIVEAAATLEMLHLATLTHDDVIDQAEMRRNRPSLRERWNNRVSVLYGDFILARVLRALHGMDDRVRAVFVETVERISRGEMLQEALRGKIPTRRQYFEVIANKTGALIETACVMGALLGDPEIEEERLKPIAAAGLALGIAYQMVDDFLDIFGEAARIGKPTWKDRGESWITLPFIQLLERVEGTERQSIESLLNSQKGLKPAEQEYLIRQLDTCGVKAWFLSEVRSRINHAKVPVDEFEDSEYKQGLIASIDFVVARTERYRANSTDSGRGAEAEVMEKRWRLRS
ncbi:MAG: polyprenyl synthetase family protein [Candidatus Bipolaricaulia bacterium]